MSGYGPPAKLTAEDFERILRANLADDWLGGLLNDPASRAVFEGLFAVLLRVQDAIDEDLSVGGYLLAAHVARPATSSVRLYRPSGDAGTIQTTARWIDARGLIWIPSAEVAVDAGTAQYVDVPLVSERRGYWINTFGRLSLTPVVPPFDPSFVVWRTERAENGRTGFLEEHAYERGIAPTEGETEAQLRNRIRTIEDLVSPVAVLGAAMAVLGAAPAYAAIARMVREDGLVLLREPFDDHAQSAVRGLLGTDVAYLDDALFYNDPLAPEVRTANTGTRWLDLQFPTPKDPASYYDFADLFTVDGVYIGGDSTSLFVAPLVRLAAELERVRAGGVRWRAIIGGLQRLSRHPTGLSAAGGWTDDAGDDAELDLVGAVDRYNADDRYVVTATGGGAGDIGSNLLYVVPPLQRTPLAVECVEVRAWVRRVGLAGTAPVLALVIVPGTGDATRLGEHTFADERWHEIVLTLATNPDTDEPWLPGDLPVAFGVANKVAAGPTDALRVSELRLEIVADYG